MLPLYLYMQAPVTVAASIPPIERDHVQVTLDAAAARERPVTVPQAKQGNDPDHLVLQNQ